MIIGYSGLLDVFQDDIGFNCSSTSATNVSTVATSTKRRFTLYLIVHLREHAKFVTMYRESEDGKTTILELYKPSSIGSLRVEISQGL